MSGSIATKSRPTGSYWEALPHATAVILVCATFPLIWVGGLVTTYDAGMAVPDWPDTYGRNLLLYPWSWWIAGPWDLFIEHGHRLLGAVSGLLTIAFVFAVFLWDTRTWMRGIALALLVGVIGQGLLGGLRVLMVDQRLALVHGCTGPLFFSMCVAAAVFTSRPWRQPALLGTQQTAARVKWAAAAAILLGVFQLTLGAILRHMPPGASPQSYRLAVFGHLLVAGLLTAVALVLLLATVGSRLPRSNGLRWPAVGLAVLVLVQVVLGAATWVVKYAWPWWLPDRLRPIGFIVQAESMLQVTTVTGHVAVGSLILGISVVLALRCFRTAACSKQPSSMNSTSWESVA